MSRLPFDKNSINLFDLPFRGRDIVNAIEIETGGVYPFNEFMKMKLSFIGWKDDDFSFDCLGAATGVNFRSNIEITAKSHTPSIKGSKLMRFCVIHRAMKAGTESFTSLQEHGTIL